MTNADPITVLVVEDEALIAMDLQMLLENAGYRVAGPVSTAEAALDLLKQDRPHIALLDINLTRSDVFSVADALGERGTPMVFVTGHSRRALTEAHKHRPLVTKPYLPDTLLAALKDAVPPG